MLYNFLIRREAYLKKRLILIAFLVLLLGVGGLVFWGQRQERLSELYYSGTIEATQADLAFQVSGRVQAVFFDEGQAVVKNQLLAVLDQEEFEARRVQAHSDWVRFQENLKQLETLLELNRKILPAEVERVEASVKALRSQLAELESGYRVQEVEQARYAYEQAQMVLVIVFAILWFKIPMVGNAFLLLAATFIFLISTLGIGLFISTVSKTQQQAMMTNFFFILPFFMLSGFVFPIANMPTVVQWLTYLNPLQYFLVIVRGIFLKGTGLGVLWPQLLGLAILGLLVFPAAVNRFRTRVD